jgi:hypothetical protein
MFIITELFGFAILYFTYRGVFTLLTAFLVVILMLGLSFHVLVRKPDGTSIRMACFTVAVWMAALFAANLFLEFRNWFATLAGGLLFLVCAATAGFSTYTLLRRPPEMDVDDD